MDHVRCSEGTDKDSTRECGRVSADVLSTLVLIWMECGQHHGEWVRELLATRLCRIPAGSTLEGWPEKDEEVRFVGVHANREFAVGYDTL